nr:PH, RCC1 and FYVE domains-containing protein 1-like [Tanacetum cinerariifolium]
MYRKLKKGTQLIKYSRKGRPKFHPFRLSPDETTLIWYSRGQERNLSLASVSKIIPGQRTICKDNAEVDVWLAGLRHLISPANRNKRAESDILDDTGSDASQKGYSFGVVLESSSNLLVPKLLESNVVIDVHRIACGVRHFSLITKHGEIFTCGEESGGRHGHGIDQDVGRPRLVEFLSVTNVDSVACGEYHTCAVSSSERVSGLLEGIQVISVAYENWHSAIVTDRGKLYTWGDGTFGAIGHGDRESTKFPKEVESLNGLKTIKVACGAWHTAAIVEIINQQSRQSTSRKLFTWGDGEKYRLGHGNKQTYLEPTCIASLIDYNFHQLACGHNTTVGLTTSGHVFTMGSNSHGQLGNPSADGKTPCMVQDKLVGEFVEEIACGAYHLAVLTTRSEVFTWGKGANGRLGHGDMEDRNTPTLVEAFKDKIVKSVSCGANFTASICIHNSHKAVKAALAPTPGKPHRVCDSCFIKLKKAAKTGNNNNNKSNNSSTAAIINRGLDRYRRTSRPLISPITEPVKYHEVKSGKNGSKPDSYSILLKTEAEVKDCISRTSLRSNLIEYAEEVSPLCTKVCRLLVWFVSSFEHVGEPSEVKEGKVKEMSPEKVPKVELEEDPKKEPKEDPKKDPEEDLKEEKDEPKKKLKEVAESGLNV